MAICNINVSSLIEEMEGNNHTECLNQSEAATNVTSDVSEEPVVLFMGVLSATQLLTLLGIVTNILNIVVFIKLGFKEKINISFFNLSVSDLCSVLASGWTTICMTPGFSTLDLPFIPLESGLVVGMWINTAFNRVTCWLTAFICVERCLCVFSPLKVKTLVTRGRILAVTIIIYVFVALSMAPIPFTTSLRWTFNPRVNRSMIRLHMSSNLVLLEVGRYLSYIVLISSFVIVTMATVVLVISLHKKLRWRKMAAHQSNTANISLREIHVAKMVALICIIFFVCLLPTLLMSNLMPYTKRGRSSGRGSQLYYIMILITLILKIINSSTNFVVYIAMSSRFKNAFLSLF